MILFDAITLVPVCVHSDLLGMSVCHNCQNDRQVNSKGTTFRTELSNNEGISQIGTSLTDRIGGHAEAFQGKPDLFFKDTLSRWIYLYILLVYTCVVMQFIFISTLYIGSFVVWD